MVRSNYPNTYALKFIEVIFPFSCMVTAWMATEGPRAGIKWSMECLYLRRPPEQM